MSGNQENKADQMPIGDSVGLYLRRARQAKKLESEEIAGQLRLKEEIIRALEDDDLTNLPAPIYTRGYIRSYALKVGIDSDELIEAYDRMLGEQSEQELPILSDVKKNNLGNNRIVIITVIIAVVLLSLFIASSLDETEPDIVAEVDADQNEASVTESSITTNEPETVVSRKETESVIEAASNEVQSASSNKAQAAKQTVDAWVNESANVNAEPLVDENTVNAEPQVTDAETVADGEDKLELAFAENSWTEVHDDNGRRLLFLMARKGRKYILTGKAPFKILLGNSPGVNVSINGEAFDQSAFNRGNVARFFVDG